jgi:hypothetical protein
VQDFNHSMTDDQREQHNTKIPIQALQLFNNRGYPRINPDTWELEWWIDTPTYNKLIPIVSNAELQQTIPPFPTGQAPSGNPNNLYDTPFAYPSVKTPSTSSTVASPPVTQNNS